MSVGDLANREERPAYVRFERRPIEDKPASIREGRYVAKDIDFVLVTPAYSKDCFECKAEQWFMNVDKEVRDGRTPKAWLDQWRKAYDAWKNGQEMPINGTPIRGWGVISPAQQEMLVRMNCLTVEDLATANDEGMKRIGMGAVELRNKARNWLASLNDHGAVTQKMTALEQENSTLRASLETLQAQVESLKSMIKTPPQFIAETTNEITASDILDEPPKRRGRPAKSEQAVI